MNKDLFAICSVLFGAVIFPLFFKEKKSSYFISGFLVATLLDMVIAYLVGK